MKRYIKSAVMDIGNEDKDIRKDVAKSTTDDAAMLEKLSRDPDRKIREQVAKNPNTPIEVLTQLSKDKSYLVCMAVASNPSTSSELLQKMAMKGYFSKFRETYQLRDVLEQIFKNPNTPTDTRIDIYKNYNFRYTALDSVARSRKTPPELLRAMAEDKDGINYELAIIARNPNTPVDVLINIYKNSAGRHSSDICRALARNPSTPIDILQKIFNSSLQKFDTDTCDAILKNPQIKGAIKKQLNAQLSEHSKNNAIDTYIGKDLWLEGELFGVMRDHPCFFRLISKKKNTKKDIYVANVVYEEPNYNDADLSQQMQAKETYNLSEEGDDDWTDGHIYQYPITPHTTEEIIKMFTDED